MVMKRLSIVSIVFVLAFFVSGTVASENLDQEESWFDAEESTEQGAEGETSEEAWFDAEESTEQDAEEETSEEDSEQTMPEAEVVLPKSDVKYVIETQLKDTGLIFLPYGPGEDSLGEIRPSESYYERFSQTAPRFPQMAPMVLKDDEEKEGTEQEEGEEGNEEEENDDDETNDY